MKIIEEHLWHGWSMSRTVPLSTVSVKASFYNLGKFRYFVQLFLIEIKFLSMFEFIESMINNFQFDSSTVRLKVLSTVVNYLRKTIYFKLINNSSPNIFKILNVLGSSWVHKIDGLLNNIEDLNIKVSNCYFNLLSAVDYL